MDVLLTIYNVRGLTNTEKQEQLARDIDVLNLDVCCLQETKITDGLHADIEVKKHKVMSLQSASPHYGNGFVIRQKRKKLSDRVSVFQLNTNRKEYECISDGNGINLKQKALRVVTIVMICSTLASF